MITKECYLRKLEITRGFNAPCIVLIIGKVLVNLSSLRYIVLEIMRRLQIDGKPLGLIFMDQAEYLQPEIRTIITN